MAQALMAVQYGQQQKHKLSLEPMVAGGSAAEANVIMSVADGMIVEDHLGKGVDHSQMVVEYIHQVDGSHYEPKVVKHFSPKFFYLASIIIFIRFALCSMSRS